jgi:predicted ATPase
MRQVLTIQDFKGFESQEVAFENLTVLAGSNSAGKSTIIQSLLLSRHVFDERRRIGKETISISVSLNGPFLLELGNTYEVVRRGKKVSESNIRFSLVNNRPAGGEAVFDILLFGDRAHQNKYELLTQDDFFLGYYTEGILNNRFYYLNAERIGPRLKYEYDQIEYPHVGYRGERTFQILSGDNSPVSTKKLFKDSKTQLIFEQTRIWLDYIIPGANFDNATPLGKSRVIEGTISESLPTNVGFGISYVLPIIVNGLLAVIGSLLIVENPEAHLHPSGQSRIGRFLVQVASAGVQVIIETHSEHVINGIRVGILEGDKLNTDQAIINYMHLDHEHKPVIREIRFDDEAEFNQFPPGFMDQEQKDIAEMVRLIRQKKNSSSTPENNTNESKPTT